MSMRVKIDRPKVSEDARISSPAEQTKRILGSHPSVHGLYTRKPLPPRHPDGGGPEPWEPGDWVRPIQVATPDVGLQFRPCLTADLQEQLIDALQLAFGVDADIRYDCLESKGTIGLWALPAGAEDVSEARDRGLARLDLLVGNETFAFFLNASYVRRMFQDEWERMPKRLDGSGRADSGGPVHLTGASLRLVSPNRVVVTVEGYDERPWPDVDFTFTVTETISVANGQIHSEIDENLDVDTSWIHALTGIFTVLFLPLGIVFAVQSILIASAEAADTGSSAFPGVASIIPQQVMIPNGLKIVANYTRLAISSGGVFVGGTYSLMARTAEVDIVGPAQVTIPIVGGITRRTYRVETADLLPPLQFEWDSESDVSFSNRYSAHPRVTFAAVGQPGQSVTRTLSVSVRDGDGVAGEDELAVRIQLQPQGGEIP